MSYDELLKDITLHDIEIMVRILERFLILSRRVERVLNRYGKTYHSSDRDIVAQITREILASKYGLKTESEIEESITETNEEEIRKIIEKIKRKRERNTADNTTNNTADNIEHNSERVS